MTGAEHSAPNLRFGPVDFDIGTPRQRADGQDIRDGAFGAPMGTGD
jgi:hypothetical protein